MTTLLQKVDSQRQPYQIKDMGRVVTGKTPSKDNPEDWGSHIDFITPTDFSNNEKYLTNIRRKISESGASRYKNMITPAQSVVVTCIGSDMGKVVISKNIALTNQQINTIIVDQKNFDIDYTYYVLKSLYPVLRSVAEEGGSTMPIITKSTFEQLEFDAPDLSTQKKIADILSAYDAKIENNNVIIKNLEAMAQAIFNEWFVDFKFPGYEKVKMVDSEMGEIPSGWKIEPLDEVADFLNGVASQKYPAEEKGDSFPVIKIREMNSGIDRNSDRATKNIDEKYIIKNGDILFAWSGSLSVMIWVGEEGILNQHIFKVTSEKYPKWFIYQCLNRHLQSFKTIAEGKATTMGHIQRHHLSEALVLIPEVTLLKKADGVLNSLFENQVFLQIENISLKAQRDQLLTRLI